MLLPSSLGSVTKVNEYIIVRDLGQGSSAEVKLCRLVLPGSFGKARKGSAERAGTAMEAPTGDASPVDEVGRHSDWDTADEDFFSDLYVRESEGCQPKIRIDGTAKKRGFVL